MAKKLRPDLLVDAFEPIPSIHAKNVAFHRANEIVGATVHNVALGNAEGEARLLLPQEPEALEEASAGTLRQDSWQARYPHTLETPVKVTTLDSFLGQREVRTPLVFKIDVEDFEASVLSGARETAARWRPRIICEILPRPHGNKRHALCFAGSRIRYSL